MTDEELRGKFVGSLLGTMVGDALGVPVEGWETSELRQMLDAVALLPAPERELNYAVYGVVAGGAIPPGWVGRYSDDTQMTIGVAESLVAHGGFDGADMARRFADNFEAHRGYGMGAHIVLQRLREGAAWNEAADGLFGGQGSYGNGASMRVAPVGLLYHDAAQAAECRRVAEAQSEITHRHFLGKEGAALQAAAVAAATRASTEDDFDPFRFIDDLKQSLSPDAGEYLTSCDAIFSMLWDKPDGIEVVDVLGNGLEADQSVPTAIYAFLAHYDSFAEAILFAIRLGGDADTIGAMCGAIAGAFHGLEGIPPNWLDALEDGRKGRTYVQTLAEGLFEVYKRNSQSRVTRE